MLEKRGGRCRTDGPIRVLSCQMRHTIAAIKAAWCLALCVEPPLGVRPTPPAAKGSPQLAASAESSVTDAERSNKRITCLLHIMSDVARVRHARGTLTLSILRAFVACAACCINSGACPVWPVLLGHYRPLQRRSASDKCSVRCRPIKQKRQNLPQLLIKTYLRDNF